jgi:hypothetical protein
VAISIPGEKVAHTQVYSPYHVSHALKKALEKAGLPEKVSRPPSYLCDASPYQGNTSEDRPEDVGALQHRRYPGQLLPRAPQHTEGCLGGDGGVGEPLECE